MIVSFLHTTSPLLLYFVTFIYLELFMRFELIPVDKESLAEYKRDMQEAFQNGAEKEYGKLDTQILPEADIDKSLNTEGALALKAVVDGNTVGGAIIVIDNDKGHLHFLYVKDGRQSRGLGQQIWFEIEKRYPKVRLWETCTPYFEKRNLHFYINCLKFSAVEFFNPQHPDPQSPAHSSQNEEEDYFFRFEKRL